MQADLSLAALRLLELLGAQEMVKVPVRHQDCRHSKIMFAKYGLDALHMPARVYNHGRARPGVANCAVV